VVQLTEPPPFGVIVKVAVPVGVPVPGLLADTVAVNTTCWPVADGFCDEITEVVVAAMVTVWLTVGAVEVEKFASPEL
jgi:hypothetical protein